MRIFKPVESPHLVRAVVLAITRADAAVVDLHVQALAAVHCGQHRTNALARRVVTLLAQHWLVENFRLFTVAFKVTIDSDPVHFATPAHFIFPHDRHVVLGLTAHDTGRAANTRAEVNGHAPFVLGIVVRRPQASVLFFSFTFAFGIFAECEFAHQRTILHRVLALTLRELDPLRSLFEFDSRSVVAKCPFSESDEGISVAADVITRLARLRPSVTERDGHHMVVLTRLNVHWQLNPGRSL